MVEAKFNLATPKITKEDTKFSHVVAALGPDLAGEVADLILKPDADAPYSKLKAEILSRTTLTETQKLKQLLSGQELGTRKPSQLLRHMRTLVTDTQYVNESVLRELFLQQMPSSITTHPRSGDGDRSRPGSYGGGQNPGSHPDGRHCSHHTQHAVHPARPVHINVRGRHSRGGHAEVGEDGATIEAARQPTSRAGTKQRAQPKSQPRSPRHGHWQILLVSLQIRRPSTAM
jgi:hypothetical protein